MRFPLFLTPFSPEWYRKRKEGKRKEESPSRKNAPHRSGRR
jgi:hypothetical protein